MTRHLDEELLAQLALDSDGPDPAGADHLRDCARCRASLEELQQLAGQVLELPELETPPSHVWTRITDELATQPGLDAAPATGSGDAAGLVAVSEPADAAPRPAAPRAAETRPVATPSGRRFGARTLAVAAGVAAIVGAGIGVGATRLADRNEPAPVEAVIRLEPLSGKSGTGNADLLGGRQLKISASGLTANQGFYEVWLINTDGKRMVSLGVLNPQTGGTFQIPAGATTQGYRIVDVSLEPDDGNPEHSHDSIIRGTLPS